MKIIDEKGRLFGKVNIIDFLVVLFVFFLIPMFYFGYKLYNKNSIGIPIPLAEYGEIEKDFKLIKIEPGILRSILLGDKEIRIDGETIGEIVWLGESRPYRYKFDIGSGEVFLKEDAKLKEIPVKLKLKAEIKNTLIFYKDKQILIDYPIEFKTKKYSLDAVPTPPLEERKPVSLNINAVLRDLDSEAVKLVSEGDKEISSDGKVLAEVIKVGKIENSSYEVNLGGGNIMPGEDSYKKQIYVKLRINGEITKGGKLFFKEQEIKYPYSFGIDTGKYSARVVLTNVLLNEKWIEVKVKFTGVIPELAKVLTEGDTETDPFGRISGKLRAIVSNKTAEASVLTIEKNKFVAFPQPTYRDIVVTLDLLCIEKEGVLYFKNYAVKIGNMVTFTSENYSIQGLIVGM